MLHIINIRHLSAPFGLDKRRLLLNICVSPCCLNVCCVRYDFIVGFVCWNGRLDLVRVGSFAPEMFC